VTYALTSFHSAGRIQNEFRIARRGPRCGELPGTALKQELADNLDGIRHLLDEVEGGVSSDDDRQKLAVYKFGLMAKMKEAQFALGKVGLRRPQCVAERTVNITTSEARVDHAAPPATAEEAEGEGLAYEEVHFWVDSFFAFLYSAFDVLAQVLNVAWHLRVSEDSVSFGALKKEAKNTTSCPSVAALWSAIDNVMRDPNFQAIRDFRCCSTHRRHIAIKRFQDTTPPTGYNSSADMWTVFYLLPDCPYALSPRYTNHHEVRARCRELLVYATEALEGILHCHRGDNHDA